MRNSSRKAFSSAALLTLLAVSARADSLNSAVKAMAKAAAKLKHNRVAVLIFPYENGDLSSGSSLVSDQVTTLLALRPGVKVIERSRLASVLSEIKLENSGAVSSSSTASMGEILGVDAILTGTLQDVKDEETLVNMRLVALPTGEIVTAARAKIDREWDDDPAPPQVPDVDYAASDSGPSPTSAGYDTPIVFTPMGRRGGGRVAVDTDMESASAGPVSPMGSGAIAPAAPLPPAAPSMTIVGHWVKPNEMRPALPLGSQYLYSIGLTLDHQGNHQQARRFFRDVLRRDAPASAPLRERAEHRLKSTD